MKKKKTRYIISLATVALVLAGCQRELLPEGDVNFGDGQIRYSISNVGVKSSADDVPVTGSLSLVSGDGKLTVPVTCEVSEGIDLGSGSAETKGALINTSLHDGTLPADLGFTVSAYKNGSVLFSGEASKRFETDAYWTMDPPQYWPLSTKLTFYAYTNAGDNTVSHTEISQTLTYTVTGDAAAHKDLMLGYYKGNGGNKGIAEMRFDHPLTAVRFKKGEMTGVTGIKSITISGLAKSGSVVMDADGEIGNWTVAGTEEYKTEVTLSGGETALGVEETSNLIGTDSEGKYNGAFLLIPQTLSEHDVTVTVVLSTESGDDVTVYADITSGTWRAGMTNTYTLGYNVEDPELLPGIFSISETKYVQFSRGNLQATYHSSSNSYTWAIARNQYDYVGNAAGNTTIGSQSDDSILDTFGWTAAGKYDDGIKQYGINISGDYSDYFIGGTDQCCDWGETVGSKGTWSVLSSVDWKYLVETRKIKRNGAEDTSSGFGNTCQWVKYNGVLGLIIYPDEYDGPKYDMNAEISIADFPSNCIFLPAAGLRNGSIMYDVTSGGRYWSNSVVNTDWAYSFDFTQGATSYATDRNRYAGQSVRLVQRFFKPHDAVNIGGKYWATMNVGATTVAGSYSTCYGDYFAWGETEPYYSQKTISETGTVTFIWKTTPKDYKTKGYGIDYDNYKWGKPGGSGFTKYNNSDGKIVLDAEDDAVTHNWGPSWRMPTEEDFMALLYACTGSTGSESLKPSTLSSKNPEGGVYWLSDDQTILMEYNGVAGCLFVDRSDPGKRVFFPAAGDISGTNVNNVGSSCFYWSRTRNTNDPCGVFRLKLNNSSIELKYNVSRYNGFPIRPVHD